MIPENIKTLTREQAIELLRDFTGYGDETIFTSEFFTKFEDDELKGLVSDEWLAGNIKDSAIDHYVTENEKEARLLADAIETGMNNPLLVESREDFMNLSRNKLHVCALGFATVSDGDINAALKEWYEDNEFSHCRYAAKKLNISPVLADNVSRKHEFDCLSAREIVDALRNTPEIFFY